MAVESTESKDTDDSETEEKNLQEIKPDDISDDAKEKEETVSENLKNDEEVIYETSEKEKETALCIFNTAFGNSSFSGSCSVFNAVFQRC